MAFTDDFELPDVDTSDADKRLVVRFSEESRIDTAKSAETGSPVYKQREFITIHIPGDKTLSVHRPIMPSDKNRFPLQYAAFKNRQGDVLVGTPLSAWPLVNESQRRELDYFNIRTVEALAEVADNFASNMMGIQSLKQAAQKYLETVKSNAGTVKLQMELAERDNQLAAQQDQITKLAEMVQQLMTDKTPAPKPSKKE